MTNETMHDDDLCPDMTATYSPQDDKLRLYPASRLDDATYQRVKAQKMQWAPKQQCFYAVWSTTREDLLLDLCGHIDAEESTREERAADRAARFENYSAKRESEAKQAQNAVDDIAKFIVPGQPILVGHHSERRHRRDIQRMQDGMGKAANLWKTASYWQDRAAASLAHARYLEKPDVRYRRIKKLEAEKRKHEKTIKGQQTGLEKWSDPDLTRETALTLANYERLFEIYVSVCYTLEKYPRDHDTYEGKQSIYHGLERNIIDEKKAAEIMIRLFEQSITRNARWIEHLENRIAYEKAMLGEEATKEGGALTESQKWDIQPGGFITASRSYYSGERLPVLRVTKKNGIMQSVSVQSRWGKRIISAEEVTSYDPPTMESAAAVKKATAKPPVVNHPGEGFKKMTRAEWADIHQNYKDVRLVRATAEHGPYRYRSAMWSENGRTVSGPVFITDQKVVEVPKPE